MQCRTNPEGIARDSYRADQPREGAASEHWAPTSNACAPAPSAGQPQSLRRAADALFRGFMDGTGSERGGGEPNAQVTVDGRARGPQGATGSRRASGGRDSALLLSERLSIAGNAEVLVEVARGRPSRKQPARAAPTKTIRTDAQGSRGREGVMEFKHHTIDCPIAIKAASATSRIRQWPMAAASRASRKIKGRSTTNIWAR